MAVGMIHAAKPQASSPERSAQIRCARGAVVQPVEHRPDVVDRPSWPARTTADMTATREHHARCLHIQTCHSCLHSRCLSYQVNSKGAGKATRERSV